MQGVPRRVTKVAPSSFDSSQLNMAVLARAGVEQVRPSRQHRDLQGAGDREKQPKRVQRGGSSVDA